MGAPHAGNCDRRAPAGRRVGLRVQMGRGPGTAGRLRRQSPHLESRRATRSRPPTRNWSGSSRTWTTRCSTVRSSRSSTDGRPSTRCRADARAVGTGCATARGRDSGDVRAVRRVAPLRRRPRARPYSERRATLERWAEERGDVSLSPSFDDGPATETAARQHHLEGVVAKRVSSAYRPGIRSRDWLKLRFARTATSSSSAGRARPSTAQRVELARAGLLRTWGADVRGQGRQRAHRCDRRGDCRACSRR